VYEILDARVENSTAAETVVTIVKATVATVGVAAEVVVAVVVVVVVVIAEKQVTRARQVHHKSMNF